jgi:alkylated DNA repair protein alkB homolog 1
MLIIFSEELKILTFCDFMNLTKEDDPAGRTDQFKPLYKLHRRLSRDVVNSSPDILIPSDTAAYKGVYSVSTTDSHESYNTFFREYLGVTENSNDSVPEIYPRSHSIVSIKELSGLQVLPRVIPPAIQCRLVKDIVDDYVADKQHKSNLTPHYKLPPSLQLFGAAGDPVIEPKEEFQFLKPMTISQIRQSKLRWITLGGQYNWTDKVYPSFEEGTEAFPRFPPRLGTLLDSMFQITCQAAIVNFYSPGDTLSPHQDVAELCNSDLISLSIGCDCIFYCGKSRNEEPLSVLLQSGDIVIMGGESRKAFHGVGRVFEDTCPEYLLGLYDAWMKSKRINLNVRQMLPKSR